MLCCPPQFIDVCFKQEDLRKSGSKSPFVSLLRTLCFKLREEASLAGIFFDEAPQKVRGVVS